MDKIILKHRFLCNFGGVSCPVIFVHRHTISVFFCNSRLNSTHGQKACSPSQWLETSYSIRLKSYIPDHIIRHRNVTCNPIMSISSGSHFEFSEVVTMKILLPSSSLWKVSNPVTKELRNHFASENFWEKAWRITYPPSSFREIGPDIPIHCVSQN